MRKPLLFVLVVVALAAAAALPAGAANSIAITSVAVEGAVATVTGTASFTPATEPVNVGGTKTALGPAEAQPVADAAGVNIVSGEVVPLANGSGLRFIWTLSGMPEQVPPEGVRYTWGFSIDGREYQLQAKRTNVASVTTTEDPVGHLQHLASGRDWFQLRGACTTSYQGTPISGCFHLAFLQGAIDVANRQLRVDLPFETRDAIGRLVAPDFKPGATLMPLETAGMSIAASFQAVVTTANVSSYINNWTPYFVGNQVSLAVGRTTSNPATLNYTGTGVLSGDTFTGTVAGLNATNDTVWARACNGLECAYASFPTA